MHCSGRSVPSAAAAHSWAAMVSGALLLAGCAIPNVGPKPQPLAPFSLASERSFGAGSAQWPAADWWRNLGDPQLAGLIEEALAKSPDLAVSRARVARARGLAEQAGAAF